MSGTGTDAAAPNRRREMLVVLGLAVLAAALLLFATGRTWLTVRVTAPGLPAVVQEGTGRTLAPGSFAFALAGLAGSLGVLATRRVLRVVVAVIVAVCGAGGAVTAWLGASATGDLLGPTERVLGSVLHVQHTAWPWVAVGAGAVLAVCGVLAAARGRYWPGMGAKYDAPRPASRREGEPDMWRALDRGDDPTA
ncbi:MAG: Trp biosynthesis-associated membrane protein [Streptosporangiales bacterium]|nr:Trp biosynthesis-associated membrane protein [Streptosporangiales bacterium]MBO0891055.1 Trp biosynthesis-associated membrane protein [Acidothermales bacterium]